MFLLGWIATPIMATLMGLVLLFVVQNVFQPVHQESYFQVNPSVFVHLYKANIPTESSRQFQDLKIAKAVVFHQQLRQKIS